nr:hypothetical protein Iba_chr05aCG9240 [Ipomoea batatas]
MTSSCVVAGGGMRTGRQRRRVWTGVETEAATPATWAAWGRQRQLRQPGRRGGDSGNSGKLGCLEVLGRHTVLWARLSLLLVVLGWVSLSPRLLTVGHVDGGGRYTYGADEWIAEVGLPQPRPCMRIWVRRRLPDVVCGKPLTLARSIPGVVLSCSSRSVKGSFGCPRSRHSTAACLKTVFWSNADNLRSWLMILSEAIIERTLSFKDIPSLSWG